ncbi:PHB depolymerase family esterase [Mesorhizobium sp. KR9-304]|uniref:extracellular catalytic domain type 1 short-chain-length polyhydroxyalkanoate depolymerase n=1 Tax=Mesorhizobium sp. KR9-304 TaxID=3156614 RepID=UPI0032B5A495
MRTISDTIARLAAFHRQGASQPADASDILPRLTGFGSNPGALEARYYLPEGLSSEAPLVVVMHGCTQTAAGYARQSGWLQLADEMGFALLLPEQQRANNANLCFNWFLPHDARRGAGESLSVREMITAMVATHGLNRHRIFITGLSAGGAMAATLMAAYPEVFSGGAIIAGLPFGSAATVSEAFDRMRGHGGPSHQELQQALRNASEHRGPWPKVAIWHGSADRTVVPSNAEAIAAQWWGVHQLEDAPTRSESNGRISRRVWNDAGGEALLELNMIAGMGHGTPLGDGIGQAGPYMLDVGISSTLEIARFWGIANDRGTARAGAAETSRKGMSSQSTGPGAEEAAGKILRQPAAPQAPSRDPHGVRKIIEDALRAAGLMR